jgi:hypothetical protein
MLLDKKLGSFSKQYIFLKDVQGLRSHQRLRLLWIIVTSLIAAWGFFFSWRQPVWQERMAQLGSEASLLQL